MSINEDLRGFEVDQDVLLFTVDLTTIGGAVYHFCNTINSNGTSISFDGTAYAYVPCIMEGIEYSADGRPPQPTFQIATVGAPTSALIANHNDLRGATITRVHTLGKYLDFLSDGTTVNPQADGTAQMPSATFIVVQKQSANNTGASFLLASPIDMEGAKLPLGVVKKRFCDQVYRINNNGSFVYSGRANPCPWAGTSGDAPYYDENNQPTTAAKDKCSKSLQGCLARFGEDQDLPFGGFVGVKGISE